MKKTKTFLYLFGVFLLCVFLLVFFLYQFTTGRLNDAMETSVRKQLEYTTERLEEKTKEIEMLATSIMTDQTVRSFHENLEDPDFDNYEYVDSMRIIKSKLELALLNAEGVSDIFIYWPEKDIMAGANNINKQYKLPLFQEYLTGGKNWFYKNDIYCLTLSYPYVGKEVENPEYFVLIETKRNFLNDIRRASTNIEGARSILLLPDNQVLFPEEVTDTDKAVADNGELENGEDILYVDGEKLTVLSDTTKENQVSILTYFNNDVYAQTIAFISMFTFAGTFLLLGIGLLLMYFFYKNIFAQMNVLVANFRKVENGELSTKIDTKATNEFNYVFNQFNQMTTGVERLLSSLNNEYRRRNLAEQKHLQAQINPHFLYNSLFYIISVADDASAVRKMTSLLAEYYRYRTKSRAFVTIEEELEFSDTYLGIMSLRKSIDYEIKTDDEALLEELIPPLLIQPLLENAVQHGIEASDEAYRILLSISSDGNDILISVEDDGPGLSSLEIESLILKINQRDGEGEQKHVGLWNVNQRLINSYGRMSALKIERSNTLGGLNVSFIIQGEESRETTNS